MPAEKTVRGARWMWAFIIVVAILVYSWGLVHEDFWYDEAYSAAMVNHSALEIIRLSTQDVHPPLYYLLLRGVRLVLGDSEWALRLLSVWGAVALVGLGAGPIRRIAGQAPAFTYAVLVLFTPAAFIYAHEARMYTWVAFAVMACTVYGFLAARDNKMWDWICFGFSSVAAAYLQYYGALAVFQVYLFMGIWLLKRNACRLKPLLITAGCVFLAYLPWMFCLFGQTMKVRSAFWIPFFDPLSVLAAYVTFFSYKEFYPGVPWSAALLGALLPALTIFGGIRAARKCPGEAIFIFLALVVFNGTLLTALYISTVLAPVYVPRYMITCLAPPLMAFSLAIRYLPGPSWRAGTIGLFIILNLFVLKDVLTQRFNGLNREMTRDLRKEIGPGELVITSDSRSLGPSFYYFPAARHLFYMTGKEAGWSQLFKVFEPELLYANHLPDILPSITSLWVIVSDHPLAIPESKIAKDLGADWRQTGGPRLYAHPYSRYTMTASRFERREAVGADRRTGPFPKRERFVADRRRFLWIDRLADVRWRQEK